MKEEDGNEDNERRIQMRDYKPDCIIPKAACRHGKRERGIN